MCGLPGSGKTTLASSLAKKNNKVKVFSPDQEMLTQNSPLKDEEARRRIEEKQWASAIDFITRGGTAILENGFWGKAERELKYQQAKAIGCRVELIFLDVPEDELKQRIQKRNLTITSTNDRISQQEFKTYTRLFDRPDQAELNRFSKTSKLLTDKKN